MMLDTNGCLSSCVRMLSSEICFCVCLIVDGGIISADIGVGFMCCLLHVICFSCSGDVDFVQSVVMIVVTFFFNGPMGPQSTIFTLNHYNRPY